MKICYDQGYNDNVGGIDPEKLNRATLKEFLLIPSHASFPQAYRL